MCGQLEALHYSYEGFHIEEEEGVTICIGIVQESVVLYSIPSGACCHIYGCLLSNLYANLSGLILCSLVYHF